MLVRGQPSRKYNELIENTTLTYILTLTSRFEVKTIDRVILTALETYPTLDDLLNNQPRKETSKENQLRN